MKEILFLLVGCFSYFGIAQNNQLFDEANALYNEGKYAEAIDKYEAILDAGVHSEELYFNLGNANYKLNNIAPSIYYYEKALQLNPNGKDIKNNLGYARNMTIDAIDKVPEVGFSKITKNIVNIAKVDTWATIAVISVMAFVILFLAFHFSYTTSRKRFTFVTSILSLLIGFFAIIMAYQKNHLEKMNKPAIVFAQESRVKTDPNQTSEEVFRLHEGTKVQVLETYEDWKKIQLPDNSTGWIPSKDLKLLKNI